MTVVVLDVQPAPCDLERLTDPVDEARAHRPQGEQDLCAACGWHWPCPGFFAARWSLIRVGVPPAVWAG